MRKLIVLLLLVSCTSETVKLEEPSITTEISTSTTIIDETTTTTFSPIQEEVNRIYRGVLRRSMYQNIPIVYTSLESFEQKKIEPEHEYLEYFFYDIRIPVINDDVACSDVVNRKIETIVSRLVAEKKSILNFTNPMEAEEEWGGFGEYLTIKYDIVEISDDVISIFISNETYSWGAAHFVSYTEPINVFVNDCSDLDVFQLFDTSNDEYQETITLEMQNQICAVLTAEECSDLLKFTQPFPSLEDLTQCCSAIGISRFGIFVQFWEYEISSFSEGSELILVPWYYLSEVIDRNGSYSEILDNYSKQTWINSVFEPEWNF